MCDRTIDWNSGIDTHRYSTWTYCYSPYCHNWIPRPFPSAIFPFLISNLNYPFKHKRFIRIDTIFICTFCLLFSIDRWIVNNIGIESPSEVKIYRFNWIFGDMIIGINRDDYNVRDFFGWCKYSRRDRSKIVLKFSEENMFLRRCNELSKPKSAL